MTELRCLINAGEVDWRSFQDDFAAHQKWLLRRGKLFRPGHVEEVSSRAHEAIADLGGGQFDWATVLGLNRPHRPSSQRN